MTSVSPLGVTSQSPSGSITTPQEAIAFAGARDLAFAVEAFDAGAELPNLSDVRNRSASSGIGPPGAEATISISIVLPDITIRSFERISPCFDGSSNVNS